MKTRFVTLLQHERFPWIAAALAVVLSLPSLDDGLVSDDRILSLFARGEMTDILGAREPWDLFRFLDSDETVAHQRDLGAAPWWTASDLRLSFFRPLSSLFHWLDFRLFPDAPWLMHAENVAVLGLLVLAVARLVRRLEGPGPLVGLATLLYAIDDAHGMPIGWIANRNTLLAALFGMLALERHVARASLEGAERRRAVLTSAVLFALSLLSGEAGVGTLAYFGAYALVLEPGTLAARARSLIAPGLVLVAWAAAYVATRSGARGSGMYLDPGHDAGAFLVALPGRVLFLLQGQLGFPPSDLAILLPRGREAWWLLLTVPTALVGLAIFWPRLVREPRARFWALGALLSCLPVAATQPNDRLLGFCGVGAFVLVAHVILAPLEHLESAGRGRRLAMRGAAGLFVALHLVLAPLLLPIRVSTVDFLLGRAQARAAASFPDAAGEQILIANAPDWFVVNYGTLGRAMATGHFPLAIHHLGVTLAPVAIERTGDRELLVRPGTPYFEDPISTAVRRLDTIHAGDRVERTTATIEILEVDESGHPTLVRWTFRDPIETFHWATWTGDRFAPLAVPAVGETVTTPPIDPAVAYFTPAD